MGSSLPVGDSVFEILLMPDTETLCATEVEIDLVAEVVCDTGVALRLMVSVHCNDLVSNVVLECVSFWDVELEACSVKVELSDMEGFLVGDNDDVSIGSTLSVVIKVCVTLSFAVS